jgi:hypothetical protein
VSRAHSSPRPVTATQFVLNISPVEFDDAEVQVGVLPCESGEQLARLRLTHGATHVFRRAEGTRIEAVSFASLAPGFGDAVLRGELVLGRPGIRQLRLQRRGYGAAPIRKAAASFGQSHLQRKMSR